MKCQDGKHLDEVSEGGLFSMCLACGWTSIHVSEEEKEDLIEYFNRRRKKDVKTKGIPND